MRTKTLLLSAAVFAAGLALSTAQSVYSVNSVGYVNKPVLAGYNLIANPLNGTNNNVNTVIPVALGDSLLYKWDKVAQHFGTRPDTYYDVGDPNLNGWYDPDLAKSTNVVNPGEGVFLYSPAATTLTFVGEVPQGTLANPIAQNYGFYSSIVPQSAGLSTMNFAGVADMLYQGWNPTNQHYLQPLTYYVVPEDHSQDGFYDDQLNKVDPAPAVGEGFLLYNPSGAYSWSRTFSVN